MSIKDQIIEGFQNIFADQTMRQIFTVSVIIGITVNTVEGMLIGKIWDKPALGAVCGGMFGTVAGVGMGFFAAQML